MHFAKKKCGSSQTSLKCIVGGIAEVTAQSRRLDRGGKPRAGCRGPQNYKRKCAGEGLLAFPAASLPKEAHAEVNREQANTNVQPTVQDCARRFQTTLEQATVKMSTIADLQVNNIGSATQILFAGGGNIGRHIDANDYVN